MSKLKTDVDHEKIRKRLQTFLEYLPQAGIKKGNNYFHSNRVKDVKFAKGELSAIVKGTYPYYTSIDLRNSGIQFDCSCPAPLPCKHVAALTIYATETFFNSDSERAENLLETNKALSAKKPQKESLRIILQENGEIRLQSIDETNIFSYIMANELPLKKGHASFLRDLYIYKGSTEFISRIPQFLFRNSFIPQDIEFLTSKDHRPLILHHPIKMVTEVIINEPNADFLSLENYYLDPISNEKIIMPIKHDKMNSERVNYVEKFHIFEKDKKLYFSAILYDSAYSELAKRISNPDKIPIKTILEKLAYYKLSGFKGLEKLPAIHSIGPEIKISIDPIIRKNELNLKVKNFYGYKIEEMANKVSLSSHRKNDLESEPFSDLAIIPITKPKSVKVKKRIDKGENGNYALRNLIDEKKLYKKFNQLLDVENKNKGIISQNQIIDFFESSVKLFKKKNFQVQIHQDLLDITKKDKPAIDIEITSSGIDWFDIQIVVPEDYKKYISIFMKAIKNDQDFIQLPGNSWVNIESLGLKKLIQSLNQLGIHPSNLNKTHTIRKGEAVSFMMDYDVELNLRADIQLKRIHENLKKSHSYHPSPSKQKGSNKNKLDIAGKHFNGELRDYQIEGVEFLNHLTNIGIGGILADDMGLGKTIQCLAYLNYRFQNSKNKEKYLIVGPLASLSVWTSECHKFSQQLPIYSWHGQTRDEKTFPKAGIILTTFGTFVRDSQLFTGENFDVVLVDEAQNIKNYKALASKSLRKIQSKIFFCVTGTPIENNLLELWALFDLVFPGYLGKKEFFQKEYAKISKEKLSNLKNKIAPFILRRTKSEVLKDLPEKTINLLPLPMTDRQKKAYDKARAIAIVDLKNAGNDYLIKLLPHLMKLRRIACHPDVHLNSKAKPQHSGKFTFLAESIDEFISSSKGILVFSQFTDVLSIFESMLKKRKIPFFYLDGKTSSKKREEMVKKFQAGENHFFLISLKAGGTALTLTRANLVIHLDPWWNPAVENQAIDRVHRIGQKNSVFVYKLYSEGTIESKVLDLQKKKMDLFQGIFDGSTSHTKISKEDLIELLT